MRFVLLAHRKNKTINHDHEILEYRCFTKFSEENFIHDLLISGIEVVEAITDRNESLNKFYDIEKSPLNVHVPLKQKQNKRAHQPNWLNQEIKDLMYERDKAQKDGYFERYKILRNKVICMIKDNKKKYFNEAIHDKKNSKALWKNLKDITNIKKADYLKKLQNQTP